MSWQEVVIWIVLLLQPLPAEEEEYEYPVTPLTPAIYMEVSCMTYDAMGHGMVARTKLINGQWAMGVNSQYAAYVICRGNEELFQPASFEFPLVEYGNGYILWQQNMSDWWHYDMVEGDKRYNQTARVRLCANNAYYMPEIANVCTTVQASVGEWNGKRHIYVTFDSDMFHVQTVQWSNSSTMLGKKIQPPLSPYIHTMEDEVIWYKEVPITDARVRYIVTLCKSGQCAQTEALYQTLPKSGQAIYWVNAEPTYTVTIVRKLPYQADSSTQ